MLLQRELRKAVRRRELHQRRRQAFADLADVLGIARIDENHVGARLLEGFAAAQRVVEAKEADGIGTRDDQHVGICARRDRSLHPLDHEFDWHQVLDAEMMLDAARQHLILDLDRLEARGFGECDRAVHVHRVAPAAAGVEHDRQLAGRAHIDRDLRHLGQGDVGLGHAFVPAERAAAQVDRLEARFLGEPRHNRIERDRRDDEVVAADQFTKFRHLVLPMLDCGVLQLSFPGLTRQSIVLLRRRWRRGKARA